MIPNSPEPGKLFASSWIMDRCPEDEIEPGLFCVAIEYRGQGLWGVYRRQGSKMVYDIDGMVSLEGGDDRWDDEWRKTHRFTLADATAIAEKALPLITVNGMTYDDWVRVRTEAGNPPGPAAADDDT